MKKKALAMLLALVMVIGLVPFSAFAEEANQASFTLTTDAGENLAVGNTFTVTATLDTNPGYASFAMDLEWNSEVVEFEGFKTEFDENAEEDVLYSDVLGTTAVWNDANGYVTFARNKNSTKNGMLFVANFKVVGTGDCGIALKEDETVFTDENDARVSYAVDVSDIENLTVPATEVPPVDPEGPSVTETGYTVSASEDKTVAVGENAEVTVKVNSDKVDTYNAYDLTLTYDTENLEYVSGTAADQNATVTENNGTIRVVGYGADKNVGTAAVTLTFEKTTAADAEVKITAAMVDIDANADLQNAPEADITDDTTKITASAYKVTLGAGLDGAGTVAPGANYTFTATDAANYDYEITATMGGKNVDVEVNEDGSYTIKNVTGNLVISATMTAKTYDVTVEGSGKDDVTADEKATYNTPYTFTVDAKDGFTYEVAVTIDGETYKDYTVENRTYTIKGTDITGDIVINVTKTAIPATEYAVKFEGTGIADANGEATVEEGATYTFTVNKEDGYDYEVTAKMGNAAVEVTEADGSYTIKNVTGNLVITVNKTAQEPAGPTVAVSEYIELDEQSMWLVTVTGVEEGEVAKYDGMSMYWSDKYEAYAWLVISADSQEVVEAAAAEVVTTAAGEAAGSVDYTGDVNGTNLVDVNDAQLTYDMYNGKYTLDDVAMLKFLNADVTADKIVNVQDAAAIVAIIVG